jgi:hypothetical protein
MKRMSLWWWTLLVIGWVTSIIFATMFGVYYSKFKDVDKEHEILLDLKNALDKEHQKLLQPKEVKKYFLSTLSIAKNESMVIRDFIKHYQEQGVDHMYIIDNGSTDDTLDLLIPYVREGFVTLFHLTEQHSIQSASKG